MRIGYWYLSVGVLTLLSSCAMRAGYVPSLPLQVPPPSAEIMKPQQPNSLCRTRNFLLGKPIDQIESLCSLVPFSNTLTPSGPR